jgi:hypothetical protein
MIDLSALDVLGMPVNQGESNCPRCPNSERRGWAPPGDSIRSFNQIVAGDCPTCPSCPIEISDKANGRGGLQDKFRAVLADECARVMPSLSDYARIQMIADAVRSMKQVDWRDLATDEKLLREFARARCERLMREQGYVPNTYVATSRCARCGNVPIWAGAPANVLGCPWCLVSASARERAFLSLARVGATNR